MEQYMNWDEGKFEKAWRSLPYKRAQLPIGKTYVHQWLDESKKRQFNNAWAVSSRRILGKSIFLTIETHEILL